MSRRPFSIPLENVYPSGFWMFSSLGIEMQHWLEIVYAWLRSHKHLKGLSFFLFFFKKKKLYGPFLWMEFNCLKATTTSRRQVPRNSWYSFYEPRKDDRLSRPWSHPVVLNTGPLDWESSTLTTRPFAKWREMFLELTFFITFLNSLNIRSYIWRRSSI